MISKYRGFKKYLYISNEYRYFSRGLSIYKEDVINQSTFKFLTIPDKIYYKLLSKIKLSSRLLRLEVDHFIKHANGFYVICNKRIYNISCNGEVVHVEKIFGSRPLCVALVDNNLLYGEYCSNNERRAVSIYSFDGFSQNELVKIHGVRHVHGVFYDDFDDLVYITTGDSDEESRIYCLNGGKLTLVHGGSQQARAVQLLFDEKYIYYGTDTPNAQNNIYKLCKKSYTSYCLGTVHSSIFYGVSLGRDMYFGSVAEPSQLNCTERVEVYKVSCDKLTLEFSSRKDMYHMKLFQYGQVKFPIYDKRVADNLYFYCVGTVNDGGYSIKKCFKN